MDSTKQRLESFLLHCHRKTYAPKSTIIHSGDISQTLYYVVSGSATVSVEDDDGHEMIVAFINAGEFIGEMGLFETEPTRSAWVKTRSECDIAEISYAKVKEIAQSDPHVLFLMGEQLSSRLRHTTQKVSDLAFVDVTGRVARALMELCDQPDAMTHPQGMQIRVTRQEIGRIVGCSREMVGRVLKNLEDQELISVSGKTIVVFGTRDRNAKLSMATPPVKAKD